MTSRSDTIRTFIALPLPPDWTEALAWTIAELRRAIPEGVRWVDPAGIHLTLKFLGPTDPSVAPRVVDHLRAHMEAAVSPRLALSGLGTFPNNRNPRVIWAGVSGDPEALDSLHQCAEAVAVGLGWDAEKRPFRPHLTLGRVSGGLSGGWSKRLEKTLQIAGAMGSCDLPVDGLSLMESVLGRGGAVYTHRAFVALSRR